MRAPVNASVPGGDEGKRKQLETDDTTSGRESWGLLGLAVLASIVGFPNKDCEGSKGQKGMCRSDGRPKPRSDRLGRQIDKDKQLSP